MAGLAHCADTASAHAGPVGLGLAGTPILEGQPATLEGPA